MHFVYIRQFLYINDKQKYTKTILGVLIFAATANFTIFVKLNRPKTKNYTSNILKER